MPIDSLLSSNREIQSAFDEAVRAASILLNVDASMIFIIKKGVLSVSAWYGCDPRRFDAGAAKRIMDMFEGEKRSIQKIQRDGCADPEIVSVLDRLGLAGGLVVPILANSKIIGIWLVTAKSGRAFKENDELIFHALADNINLTIQRELLVAENLRYLSEAQAIYEITMEISQLMDLDRVLKVIVEKTCALLNAEISYIALADEDERVVRVRVTHGARGEALHKVMHNYGEGVGGWVAANRTPLLVDNYYKEIEPQPPGISEILATEGIISAICVPMCTHGGLVGVLYATSRQEAAFNHSQLELLQALGNQAAIAIENARLYDEQKVSAEKLRSSITTHERLLNLVLNNQGLQAITDTLSELVGCPVAVENSDSRVLCWSSRGCSRNDLEPILGFQESAGEFWRELESIDGMNALYSDHRIRIPSHPERGNKFSRVVTPIVGGKKLLGYVSALEVEQPLNDQQYAAVEEASIIFALEFLKQETARASMLQHVIAAQEEERKRIARELHDETSQALTALMVGLESVRMDLAGEPMKAAQGLDTTKSIADGMLENIHRLISDLRPSLLDDLGLIPAIAWYGEQRLKPLGIAFRLESEGLAQRLSSAIEIALYRIVQEAINNIIRHAQALTVIVRLILQSDCLTLQVVDDGLGFDPEILQSTDLSGKSLGLWGMQERVSTLKGDFNVQTAVGEGTTVTVRVPVSQDEMVGSYDTRASG